MYSHLYNKIQAENKNMKEIHQNMTILSSQIIDNFFTVLHKKIVVCSELSTESTQNILNIYNRGEKTFYGFSFYTRVKGTPSTHQNSSVLFYIIHSLGPET